MSIDIDRRIANAIKRLNAQIDALAASQVDQVRKRASWEQHMLHERFNAAARSIGQSRRHRNAKGVNT